MLDRDGAGDLRQKAWGPTRRAVLVDGLFTDGAPLEDGQKEEQTGRAALVAGQDDVETGQF